MRLKFFSDWTTVHRGFERSTGNWLEKGRGNGLGNGQRNGLGHELWEWIQEKTRTWILKIKTEFVSVSDSALNSDWARFRKSFENWFRFGLEFHFWISILVWNLNLSLKGFDFGCELDLNSNFVLNWIENHFSTSFFAPIECAYEMLRKKASLHALHFK